uniref:Glutamine cyclotransferase n=1 Tax=Oryza meridionalis TaxID=40149 RepID=A0A0E0DVG0_9ORYZ
MPRRRALPPPHRRATATAMPPANLSISAPSAAAAPPPPLYLRRRPLIAAAALLFLLVIVVLAAAHPYGYAPWLANAAPAALLRRPVSTTFYSFDLLREYPHDPYAFTQGLLYGGNDTFFESTGLYHRSSVRRVDLKTGKVLVQHEMDGRLFGEGLTLLNDKLFQVVWMKNQGFIYDRHNFSKRESFTHKMSDGWGLATDGKVLFGSDDCIARVSHEDGLVVGWIFLHELRQHLWNSGNTEIDVLNGIAWDEENQRLFVTGKLWPKIYEIKLRPVDGPQDGSVEKLCPKASFYR